MSEKLALIFALWATAMVALWGHYIYLILEGVALRKWREHYTGSYHAIKQPCNWCRFAIYVIKEFRQKHGLE